MHQRAFAAALVALACNGTHAAGQDGDRLRVPPGFKISVFAEHLQGVRFLALGPGDAPRTPKS